MRLGKDKHAISVAVFLLLSASASGQAGKNYKYQLDGTLQKSDVITENQSLIINYSISELNIESILNNEGSFYRVTIPGHTPTVKPGQPELPVYSKLITIPEGSEYKVKISEVRSTRINPSRKKFIGILIPSQESETKQIRQQKPAFILDKKVYSERGVIKSDTVKIELLGTIRNKKLANLYVSSVRYNPRSNVLEVITSMKIEIIFSYPDNFVAKSLMPESVLFNKSLNKGVLNYNPDNVIPGYSDQPVKMVILTDTAFRKKLEPFFRWKIQKGYKLKVLYRGANLAGDTYTQLKDTLTKIYKSSSETNPPPEYLLIIGDVKRIPYSYYNNEYASDMYYGEFDGNNDYIPEMYIGRLPVADTTELKSVISKIIQYEKFQFADTNKFYTNALVTAGSEPSYADFMNGQVKYATNYYLNSSNNINNYHFYYPQSIEVTAIDSMKKIINHGVSFLNYTGHGSANGWLFKQDGSEYYLKASDVTALGNKNMYPFIISNACSTAEFNTAASFGNKMVVSGNKGAIGFIGCSYNSFWYEDYYWAVGAGTPSADPTYLSTGLGAYDRMFHTHGESASDWYFTMGQINYAGNLAVSASTSSWKQYYWETYNLIGDPSIIPIIGKPDSFKISLPDTLPNGIKSLSLNIDPFAYIAVSHFDTLWDASYASTSGSVVLDMPGLSNDSCLVVITGQNKKPLIKKIYLSNITREFLNLTATTINDSSGNNNNKADYGESLYLKPTISNLGLTDAHNLYAVISSNSDWITINNDSVLIGTLAAGSEITLPDKLELTISDNVPDMGVATINLILKDQKTEKHFTIDLCIHAPELKIISCILNDSISGNGDHIADPGETIKLVFKVLNQGSSNISGQFNISAGPFGDITVLEPSVKSGILKFGEFTDIPVSVEISKTASSGSFISVASTLNCSPYILTKDFTFRVGKIRESFEASSFNVFPWINISSIPWTITGNNSIDGVFSARSGAISHNRTSSLVIRNIYSNPDSVKFYYKVSSEPSWDNFSFKLNGVEVLKKSGEIPWTKIVIPVPAGLNTMEWRYSKDTTINGGSDCVWIDMIDFAGSGSVNYIQKDIQITRLVSPTQKDEYGQEIIAVKVINNGKDILNNFNLAYEVNNQAIVQQHYENQAIHSGDSATILFDTRTDMSKFGIYKIAAYVYENNDDYIFNDTCRLSIEYTKINEVLVYPNPFINKFTLFINSRIADRLQISITSASGVKIYSIEKDIVTGKNTFTISDLRLLPSLYYLNIHGSDINKTIPILSSNKK
jgi:hypothetical protein